MKRIIAGAAILGVVLMHAEQGFAYSHQYLNQMRSSTESHVMVNQSIEGEFGKYRLGSDEMLQKAQTQNWQGYGVRTGVGIELMKFIQFGVAHTLSQMRTTDALVQRMSGSKLSGEVRFVFSAPLANLEAGAGVLGSRLDYQKEASFASYYGSGRYYTLGLNHFMTSNVSVFTQGKINQEHLVRTSGDESFVNFRTDTTSIGAGVSIWL